TGIERPARELDEIREQHRHFALTGAPTRASRERLPDLERAEAELVGSARAPGVERGDAARDAVDRLATLRREAIAEALVPRQPLSQALDRLHHGWRAV